MGPRIICAPLAQHLTLVVYQRAAKEATVAAGGAGGQTSAASTLGWREWASLLKRPMELRDRIETMANDRWAQWERKPSRSWQKRCTDLGNRIMQNVPYREYALKSFPVDSKTTLGVCHLAQQPLTGQAQRVSVVYPSIVSKAQMEPVLHELAGRYAFHRSRMQWSLIALPAVMPLALIPVLPNIPGFYLTYRAYSHWKAMKGSEYLRGLLQRDALDYSVCHELDSIYTDKGVAADTAEERDADLQPLISREQLRTAAEVLACPLLETDGLRALIQLDSEQRRRRRRRAKEE